MDRVEPADGAAVSKSSMKARLPLVPVVVLLAWGAGEACSCAPEPTAVEALSIADAVFEGTVVDQRAYVSLDADCTGPAIEYDVVVRRAWKGVSDGRVSLQRVSACASSFRVGETALIYAYRHRGELTVPGCLPIRRIDAAAADVAQLGAPVLEFRGDARPVATSLPISRWIRAHVVAGLGVYAFLYTRWEWASPTWDMILPAAMAALFAASAVVALLRRRWRAGAWLLVGTLLTAALGIFWMGRVYLRSDWSEPFLSW